MSSRFTKSKRSALRSKIVRIDNRFHVAGVEPIAMSTRTLRVNELIHREIGSILRKRYQSEAVTITITGVEVTPDIREGRVYVAVTGDEAHVADRFKWIRHHARAIRHELARNLVLKQMPLLTYELDTVTERGNRVLDLLDQLKAEEPKTEPPAGD